jgi:hypothetical protein
VIGRCGNSGDQQEKSPGQRRGFSLASWKRSCV